MKDNKVDIPTYNPGKSSYEHFALTCSWLVMIVILITSRSVTIRNALFPVIFANFFGMFFHMFLNEGKKVRYLILASIMLALCIYGLINYFGNLDS